MNSNAQQAVALVPRINKLIDNCQRVGDLKIVSDFHSSLHLNSKNLTLKDTLHPRLVPNKASSVVFMHRKLQNSEHSNRNSISVSFSLFDFRFEFYNICMDRCSFPIITLITHQTQNRK
jgi:hypothetical protein